MNTMIILYLLAELNYERFMFKKLCILLIFQIKGDQTFNRQLSYAQLICNIRKITEHMQANCRQYNDRQA